jgi:N-acetylneuraminic acid mutarotase
LPESLTEVSVTTDGMRIYLAGGFKQDGGKAEAPRTLFVYHPEEDRWEQQGEIPRGVNHAGFVHLQGKLYLIGGYRENTFEPIPDVHIYDLETRSWRAGTPMPTPRGALVLAVVDGRIHAIGGTQTGHGSVATHEVYDPTRDSWSSAAAMPTARDHHGAAVFDGKIHVVAGRAGQDFTKTVHEVYDPATDRWRKAAPLPTGRSGVAAVLHDGWIYVFGGEAFGAVSKTFDEAERYDPGANRWEMLPPMPTARHGLGAASVGRHIYVISGGPQPGFAFSDANERLTVNR